MPKYMLHVNYTAEGAKGLLRDGGTKRRAAAQAAAESVGGRVEAMYFAFGSTDAFVIADMPDNASCAAIAMTMAASGGATGTTTVLLSPEEMDQACRKTAAYKPPGQ